MRPEGGRLAAFFVSGTRGAKPVQRLLERDMAIEIVAPMAGEPPLPLAAQPAHQLGYDLAALLRTGIERFLQVYAANDLQSRHLAGIRNLLLLVALEFGDLASDR
jgi:hypothetical protein